MQASDSLKKSQIDFETHWKDAVIVAFDTETSGKYPLTADVCEIAAVKYKAGKVIDTFQTFCKTRFPMTDQVIAIHHISNEMISDAPTIKSVLPAFKQFINGGVLVAHNAPFDLGFLAAEMEYGGMALPQNPVLCTCVLSLKAFPKSPNHKLQTLIKYLGIQEGKAHRALDDSEACLKLALKNFEQISGSDGTLGKVFEAHGGPFNWERFSINELKENSPAYKALVEASREQLVVELIYDSGSQPGVPRKATGKGLVRNPSGDYFVGLCHREKIEKRFYLQKLRTAKIID